MLTRELTSDFGMEGVRKGILVTPYKAKPGWTDQLSCLPDHSKDVISDIEEWMGHDRIGNPNWIVVAFRAAPAPKPPQMELMLYSRIPDLDEERHFLRTSRYLNPLRALGDRAPISYKIVRDNGKIRAANLHPTPVGPYYPYGQIFDQSENRMGISAIAIATAQPVYKNGGIPSGQYDNYRVHITIALGDTLEVAKNELVTHDQNDKDFIEQAKKKIEFLKSLPLVY